jgi:3-oxoacyl-[acyl-carrier-protein] synthase II
MATEDAGLTGALPDEAGVLIGSSRGGISTLEHEAWKTAPSASAHSRLSAYLMASTTVGMAASTVAQKLKTKGHCSGLSSACASGTTAIGEAYRLVSHGYAPVVLAGGADAALCRLAIGGYGAAGAPFSLREQAL